jgi:hypothetical protein
MIVVRAVAVAGLWLLGCASASPEVGLKHAELRHGDPDAAPEFAALPDVQTAQQSPRVLRGLSLARQVLARGLPVPPDDRRFSVLQSWIDQTVAPWVEARRDSLDETKFQFGVEVPAATPATPAPTEGTIAWGVLGLLEENTASELTRIPAPAELDTEPEIADIFRELVSTQARPFRSAALSKYKKCYELGLHGGDELSDWTAFCGLRYERVHRAL